jgi:hypothetical protein
MTGPVTATPSEVVEKLKEFMENSYATNPRLDNEECTRFARDLEMQKERIRQTTDNPQLREDIPMQSPPRQNSPPQLPAQNAVPPQQREGPAMNARAARQQRGQPASDTPRPPAQGTMPSPYRIGTRRGRPAFFVNCAITGTELEVLWYQVTILTRPRRYRPSEVRGRRLILAEDRQSLGLEDLITTQPFSNYEQGILSPFEDFCDQNGRDPEFGTSRTPEGLRLYEDREFLRTHLFDDLIVLATWHVPGEGQIHTRKTFAVVTWRQELEAWDGTIFGGWNLDVSQLRLAYDEGRVNMVEQKLEAFRSAHQIPSPTIPLADYESFGLERPADGQTDQTRRRTANRRLSARVGAQRVDNTAAPQARQVRFNLDPTVHVMSPQQPSRRQRNVPQQQPVPQEHTIPLQQTNLPQQTIPQQQSTPQPAVPQEQPNHNIRQYIDITVRSAIQTQLASFQEDLTRMLQEGLRTALAGGQPAQNNRLPTPRQTPERF